MSMDLSEFLDVFLEECFEGLEVMESGLLNLDEGTDLEEINTIFRAAHSMKGGSAAFGFNHISEFTHVMETLLDQLRSGKRSVDRASVDLLLASVDVLRAMVEGLKSDERPDEEVVSDLTKRLQATIEALPEQAEEKAGEEVQPEVAGAEKEEADSAKSEAGEESEPPPVDPPQAQDATPSKPRLVKSSGARESSSIRVSIEKVDQLINLVGELVITQSMLNQVGEAILQRGGPEAESLLNGLAQLERNTRELQENVLQIRMLPISFAFNRFPRLVRDLSNKMGKMVELVLTGEQTEVDKTVLEKIGDPLVHLVRNALDHGLETPEARRAAGKPEKGRIELSAQHESGNIVIRISDDGAGLDREKILKKAVEKGLVNGREELSDERIDNLIFQPGFSTADRVSDLSGRGVGMDVVKRNINDLGGTVAIQSEPGKGSTVTIRLPLTLAILDGQLANVGEEIYILPLISIVESLQVRTGNLKSVAGAAELYRFRDEYIPIIRLNRLFGIRGGTDDLETGLLVVVEVEGQHVGLFVDGLMGQQQVVIKSLETNFQQLQGLAGATILGDGRVALILDVPGLVRLFYESLNRPAAVAAVS
jgi:Chemotaxis protein histidine kinase and related kinases